MGFCFWRILCIEHDCDFFFLTVCTRILEGEKRSLKIHKRQRVHHFHIDYFCYVIPAYRHSRMISYVLVNEWKALQWESLTNNDQALLYQFWPRKNHSWHELKPLLKTTAAMIDTKIILKTPKNECVKGLTTVLCYGKDPLTFYTSTNWMYFAHVDLRYHSATCTPTLEWH